MMRDSREYSLAIKLILEITCWQPRSHVRKNRLFLGTVVNSDALIGVCKPKTAILSPDTNFCSCSVSVINKSAWRWSLTFSVSGGNQQPQPPELELTRRDGSWPLLAVVRPRWLQRRSHLP